MFVSQSPWSEECHVPGACRGKLLDCLLHERVDNASRPNDRLRLECRFWMLERTHFQCLGDCPQLRVITELDFVVTQSHHFVRLRITLWRWQRCFLKREIRLSLQQLPLPLKIEEPQHQKEGKGTHTDQNGAPDREVDSPWTVVVASESRSQSGRGGIDDSDSEIGRGGDISKAQQSC
jgi:hypothetical protein